MKIAVVAAAALAACGSERKPELSSLLQRTNGPAWVQRGSGAFGGEKGKVFYGVGIASGIRNASMRRSTSESRARDEIARTLDTYVTVLHKDYLASADGVAAAREEQLEQALKTYSQTELSGAVIIDHWTDSDGTEYALAQLDMAAFKANMARMKELSARVREAVRAHADKAFDELGAEEARRDTR